MIEIKGKVNTAICYATVVEDEAIEQIRRMCDHDFTAGSQIRIMPDVHAGKGCTIGTTMTITDKAVPNIVGVDIGCGMYTAELGMAMLEDWTIYSWYCPNCKTQVAGLKNKKNQIRVICTKCSAEMVRTVVGRRHDVIDIYAPIGMEHSDLELRKH